MKHLPLLTLITVLCFTACQPKEKIIQAYPDGNKQITQAGNHWRYYYPTGELFAETELNEKLDSNSKGTHWHLYSIDGQEYWAENYDSIVPVELGPLHFPMTMQYYKTENQQLTITQLQFFTNGTLRSLGQILNQKREGRWYFYHPNGQVMTEAIFQDDKENGVYTVFRENGIPYFRGTYINGNRAGVWEFYDEEANLVHTQNYD